MIDHGFHKSLMIIKLFSVELIITIASFSLSVKDSMRVKAYFLNKTNNELDT